MKTDNKTDLKNIILKSIEEINKTRVDKKKILKAFDADLAKIDSLGVVMLILKVEEKVKDKYNKSINLSKLINKNFTLDKILDYLNEKI